MKEFKSLEPYHPTKYGNVFAVKGKPGDYKVTPEELVGEHVLIDGVEHLVLAVDRYAIALPYPYSAEFGLVV